MNKVSVVVTCYNHEKYIEQCLRSIFQQSFQNIELMIINDGSTDKSEEIILETVQESPFKKTEYIFQENKGSCFSRNLGLDWCTGDFVLLMDSDNFLPDNYIQKMLEVIIETGKDIAYASLKNAETGEIINEVPDFSLERFVNVNFIDTCSLIRASVLDSCRFDMKLNRKFMQDYDFFFNLISKGAEPIKVEGLYQNYRVLSNSLGNKAEDRLSRIEWFKVYMYIVDKYPEYKVTETKLFSSWYLALNHEFEDLLFQKSQQDRKIDMLIQKGEEKTSLLELRETLINEKDTYIYNSDLRYLDVVNSTAWKVGRAITFPFRKIKDLTKLLSVNSQSINEKSNETKEGIALEISNQEVVTLEKFPYNPLLSILIPVYNVEKKWLKKCIDSILKQDYENWEICIADDASTNEETIAYLQEIEKKYDQIHVVFRKENGHISAATNSALELAKGEFIALVDNDDELTHDALYEVVKTLNKDQSLNLIYSDEDKIDEDGKKYDAHFKPDWSPDLILNQNYISHLGVYRTDLSRSIGGFRIGYEGAQDHDFLLRFTEKISSQSIYHIPKILYHWRALTGSTASNQQEKTYAFENGVKAVKEALTRRGISGEVTFGKYLGVYDIKYDIIENFLVSIIIPTRNSYDDLKLCIDSIIIKTTYDNYEIIVADNNSDDPKMEELYIEYQNKLREKFRVVSLKIPFNYSRINNLTAKEAKGDYLLFLNNDTSIISGNWIELLLGFAQFDRVGCVGAKLWYFDDTIQHAGVILGIGRIAGHSFLNADKNSSGYFSRLYVDYNYTAVTAACLMVSKKDFGLVNGFDEELEVAFNDVDLCIRVYQLGRDNVWAHQAELYHYESKSRGKEDTPEKKQRFEGEIDKMIKKHGELLSNDPAYNINFSLDASPFMVVGRK